MQSMPPRSQHGCHRHRGRRPPPSNRPGAPRRRSCAAPRRSTAGRRLPVCDMTPPGAHLDETCPVLDLVPHGAHLAHAVGDALLDRQRHDARAERLEHRGVGCPPVGVRGPRGPARPVDPRDRSPSAVRRRGAAPVCTNRPRFRTVVNPAASVRRALATARNVRTARSSCTALNGLRWSALRAAG